MKATSRSSAVVLLVALLVVCASAFTLLLWPGKAQAAGYVVTLTSDTLPNGVAGELRWAINSANGTPGVPDTISFNILNPGLQTISPLAPLPAITDTVFIDGYTQPGSAPPGPGTPATILIELDGTLAGAADGLSFQVGANGSQVRGLAVNRFSQNGISIQNANNVTVDGNHIGTDGLGATPLPNAQYGVYVWGTGNTVGGVNPSNRNVISGNGLTGVIIYISSGNNVEGNYIGTDAAGTAALPNSGDGVLVTNNSTGNTIGGTTASQRNVISGNGGDGISVFNSSGNFVQGNYVGTDAGGTSSLANAGMGVWLNQSSSNNTIGGANPGEGNLISGNNLDGIYIYNGTGNAVSGNYIGTDLTGTGALANGGAGILLTNGANSNTIGGTTAGERNVISGNTGNGLYISASSSNDIEGNYIGTDLTGTGALANGGAGLFLTSGANSNTIGGTTAGERNVVSGNNVNGISIYGCTGNVLQGNYIGTDLTGTGALANGGEGVFFYNGANSNTIGGSNPGEGNIISGNTDNGVRVDGSSGNAVEGNYIGTDLNGTVALANGGAGVSLDSGSNSNTVGGANPGEGNLISGNNFNGIRIYSNCTGNAVEGNYIGTDASGTAALPNVGGGIYLSSVATNTVGGANPGEGNLISGNGHGIYILNGTDNTVFGNYIGTDASGTAALPNSAYGIILINGANSNTIGGTTAAERNVVSGNTISGIRIDSSTGNAVCGNFIGTDASGTAALPNGSEGVYLTNSANSNTIGGSSPGEGNIISGNANHGVWVEGSTGNAVEGNYIGTDGSGTGALANGGAGVFLDSGANSNTIGGTTTAERNVVSGNTLSGIRIDSSTDNTVCGNFIGTDASGTAALPNGSEGVYLTNSANSTTIGGSAAAANLIAYNSSNGVSITSSSDCEVSHNQVLSNTAIGVVVWDATAIRNKVSQNSLSDNGGLAIDLLGDGVTPNDGNNNNPAKPNRGYNFPVFDDTEFPVVGGNTYVSGTAPPNAHIEFYYTGAAQDPSGHGEGLTYLGAADASGTGDFSTIITGASDGDWISAIAISPVGDTSGEGNTSEFSANAKVRTGYTVDASVSGGGGTVDPASQIVLEGRDATIDLQPDANYHTASITDNGTPTALADPYEITNVTADHNVVVAYAIDTYTWYLAEGSTGGDFETFVLVQNPGASDVTVDLTFMTSSGEQPGPQDYNIAAGSRHTFKVNDYVTDWDVSTVVTAYGGDVICERAMYGGNRTWAHDSIGYSP